MKHRTYGSSAPPSNSLGVSDPYGYSATYSRSFQLQGGQLTPQGGLDTPAPVNKDEGAGSSLLLSTRRSIFDESPFPLTASGMTPGTLDGHGLTPLSTIRNTFDSPFPTECLPDFSSDDTFALNKSLFEESNLHATPPRRVQHVVRISIGSEDGIRACVSGMKLSSIVSISPIRKQEKELQPPELRTMLSQDSDVVNMPPPTAPRAGSTRIAVSTGSKIVQSLEVDTSKEHESKTPLSSMMKSFEMDTPSTAATTEQGSFWSDALDTSMDSLRSFSPSEAQKRKITCVASETKRQKVENNQ